ncbi:MAG: toll/interleukin-1 receptor domain-containing protein [Euryarchaeota archaeon]|nr:toll/interleukin-1 receptor domain-containing protein [Euryarchaeota archaeon]
MSSEDIGKGKRWSPEIAQALEDAKVGVICLTKENLNRPWLLFEAGALSKIIKGSLVCTFLLDVEQADIGNDNPLSQFQATKNSKGDVFSLLKTINEAYGEKKLDDKILEPTFEKWWLDFETKISSIPFSQIDEGNLPVRTDRELLAEILETVRSMERVFGTKDVWRTEAQDIAQFSKDKKPVEWECRNDILTKANQNYVQTNSKCFERNALITLTPIALAQRIDVNGIKLTLKYADNNEISDDTILTLRKGDKFIGNHSEIGKYEYGDLKRKVTLRNKASLSFNEILAIYLEENYVGKEIIPETIKFYVDSCFK